MASSPDIDLGREGSTQSPAPEGSREAERTDERLPRTHRLRRRSDIQRVQRQGMKFPAGCLLLLLHPNTLGTRRLGLTVSGKVGNSVIRSRVKRLLREVFRKRRAALPPSLDVVVVARPSAAMTSLEAVTADFLKAAEQARRKMSGPPRGLPRSPEGEAP